MRCTPQIFEKSAHVCNYYGIYMFKVTCTLYCFCYHSSLWHDKKVAFIYIVSGGIETQMRVKITHSFLQCRIDCSNHTVQIMNNRF